MESTKVRVSFFGASVTQQKDGFPKHFTVLEPDSLVDVFGYGSRHLKDAGVCYIDDALRNDPALVFIDWFSTGYIKQKNAAGFLAYIEAIIWKCLRRKAIPVFLFLPQRGDVAVEYEYLKKCLVAYGAPYLDISREFSNLDEILRDDVHTTEAGSIAYARYVSHVYQELLGGGVIKIGCPLPNKYTEIKRLVIDKTAFKSVALCGEAEVVGFSQLVGPYTGYVSINNRLISNWDRWCYYEREMLNLAFSFGGVAEIEVLQFDFDKSDCEYLACWDPNKVLKLQTLFYIGRIDKVLIDGVVVSNGEA